MKLFILTATLFFGAQAYAGQVQPHTPTTQISGAGAFPTITPPIQAILNICAADVTPTQIQILRLALTQHPSDSNEYETILFHAVEANRIANYRAEKNPANRP
ncbi:MAG: hypothetical protein WC747_01530 [Candidatus Babeliales bacterium]|jgi:hypothetical protein